MGAGLSIHQSREFVQDISTPGYTHIRVPNSSRKWIAVPSLRRHSTRVDNWKFSRGSTNGWFKSTQNAKFCHQLNVAEFFVFFDVAWSWPNSDHDLRWCFLLFPPSIEFFFLSRELASQQKQFILLAVTARGFKLSILFRCHWPEFMKILTRLLVGKLKFIFSFFQWSDALDEIRNVFQCDPARVVNHLAHIKHAIKRISPARKSSFGSVYLISRRKHNCRWINWFCGAIADKARSSSVKGRSHHKQTSFRTSNRCRRSLPSWFPISSSFVLRTLEPKKAGTERFADSQMFEQIIGRKVSAPIKMIAVRASWADTHFATTHLMKMLFISNWVYHAV